MNVVVDHLGNEFLDFTPAQHLPESKLDGLGLTHSLVVVRIEGKVLLILNPRTRCWELPGGKVETGESVRACAIREVEEETGQRLSRPEFRGVMTFWIAAAQRTEQGALFTAEHGMLRGFRPGDEADAITLWDGIQDIGCVNAIDSAIAALELSGFRGQT